MGGAIKTGDTAIGDIRIGLLPGPIHTDLLLPVTDDVRARLAFLVNGRMDIEDPGVAWVVVGWGARDFYTTTGDYTDLRPRPVWRAITGDASVMRVFLAGEITEDAGITWIDVDAQQFATLLTEVRAGFAGADPAPLDHPGLNGQDTFYPGTGRFNLFRTCNVWVGDVLRKAGLRVGIWTPFTWSLPSA